MKVLLRFMKLVNLIKRCLQRFKKGLVVKLRIRLFNPELLRCIIARVLVEDGFRLQSYLLLCVVGRRRYRLHSVMRWLRELLNNLFCQLLLFYWQFIQLLLRPLDPFFFLNPILPRLSLFNYLFNWRLGKVVFFFALRPMFRFKNLNVLDLLDLIFLLAKVLLERRLFLNDSLNLLSRRLYCSHHEIAALGLKEVRIHLSLKDGFALLRLGFLRSLIGILHKLGSPAF